MKDQAIGLRSNKKLTQFTTKQFTTTRYDFQCFFSEKVGLCFTFHSSHNMKIRMKKVTDIFVHDQLHFFMNTNPGFAKMNTWMTIGDNETFQMQRLTLVEHRNLDTVSKPCRDNTSFSLTRCSAAEGFMKNEEEKNRKKIDKKLPFAVALRGAFPNQLDASFPGTRQHLVLTIVKTFTSSGTSRWDLTILAHAFSGIFQNDI